mgnify:CR=1 FL=1
MEDFERTEKPTAKRKSELRSKGNVARSYDFSSSLSLFLFIVSFFFLAPYIFREISSSFRYFTSMIYIKDFDAHFIVYEAVKIFLYMLSPILVLSLSYAVIAGAVPSGFVFIKPKLHFEKFNFINALKRMFSIDKVIEILKNSLKIIFIFLIIYFDIKKNYYDIISISSKDFYGLVISFFLIIKRIVFKIAVVYLIISIIDLFYKIYDYTKKSKMTKQEVKEEFKASEGNPQIKGKIRTMMRMFTKRNKLSEISKASVVITNPTHFAVALKYESKIDKAPIVVAKGRDYLALKIIEIARRSGVYVKQNPPLARSLYKMCEVGDEINPIFYRAVAEILAVVYKEKRKK